MATNPFANLGLGNMGQEIGILSTAGDAFKQLLAQQAAKAIGGSVGAMMGGDSKMGAALMNPSTYNLQVPAVPQMSAPSPQMNPNPLPTAPALPLLPDPNQPDPNLPGYSRFLFSPKE